MTTPPSHNSLHYWTPHEEQELLNFVNQYGTKNWQFISNCIKTRTSSQCAQRYRRLICPPKRSPWTPEEDSQLENFVKQFGVGNWAKIVKKCPNRSGKQIRERYLQILNPSIVKQKFTKKDDIKIINMIRKFGFKWKTIAMQFEARSDNHIKNRFYSHILKKIIKESPEKYKDILAFIQNKESGCIKQEEQQSGKNEVKKRKKAQKVSSKTKKIRKTTKLKLEENKIEFQNEFPFQTEQFEQIEQSQQSQQYQQKQQQQELNVDQNSNLVNLNLLQNQFLQLASKFLQPQFYPQYLYQNLFQNQRNSNEMLKSACKQEEENKLEQPEISQANNNNSNENQKYYQQKIIQPIILYQSVPTFFINKF